MLNAEENAVHGRPATHAGRWGKATLEVCLAVLASARKRGEVFLSHQTPTHETRWNGGNHAVPKTQ